MSLQKSILLITQKNEDLASYIEEICFNQNLTLFKLYNIVDGISAINESRYSIVIIDIKYFKAIVEIFSLFKRKNFYVPYIILISEQELEIYDENVGIVKRTELYKLSELIAENIEKDFSNFANTQNSFLRTTVEKMLGYLGFSRRYKGFDYMTETVIRIINNSQCKNSFKKYIYPHISVLYNVSEQSIERDIRNLISKINPNNNFNFKHTTKNIVNSVVYQVKDYLNKLGNYKSNY